MKVVVSVHGRFHGFDLAAELQRRGHLARLLTTYPASVARRFLPKGTRLRTKPSLELRRRLYDRWRLGRKPDLAIAEGFARFAVQAGIAGADLLVGWSSAVLEAIAVAQAEGVKVVVERGSTHIQHQAEVLSEEYASFGLTPEIADPRIIERELAEYEAADAIAVPIAFAADTFVRRGIPRDRLIVNPYGVDLARFQPAAKAAGGRPRILFVGRVGLRKGVPWLLRAFAPLADRAELHLVGPLEAGMDTVLTREPMDSVTVHGPVPGDELPAYYGAADVFCLPSLEEGFALVLLQAMAAGLPVVTTREAGGEEAVATGAEGAVVPASDPAALGAALAGLLGDAEARRAAGTAARARADSGFAWSDYGDRAVAAYRRLLGPC